MASEITLPKSSEQLAELLRPARPDTLVPELVDSARNPEPMRDSPGARLVRSTLEPFLTDARNIPHLPYTLYREFLRTGERRGYQTPYRERRAKTVAVAVQVLLGDNSYVDLLHDYLVAICEESNWVIPAHENREIDLTSAATGLSLSEILVAVGDRLADEVVQRVEREIERRIFEPYLERHEQLNWYRGHSNWNGVCNGAVGATFLHLERDPERLTRALCLVLEGLEVFLNTAFGEQGSSSEGTSYWQYGLTNLIAFSEMLRLRTDNRLDILADERVRSIAAYPTRTILSPGRYANFSDCEEVVPFNPGLISRLVQRTGVTELLEVLAEGAPLLPETHWGNFHNMWRAMIWWDGHRPDQLTVTDAVAEDVGMVRLTASTADGSSMVLAAKAGHNAENHNQNDVGSFILHVDGESLLCDPGRGLYSRSYFGPHRYDNIFANSYGHSVPVVGGHLQAQGQEYRGEIVSCDIDESVKSVTMTLHGAYEIAELESIRRTISVEARGGAVTIEDEFRFRDSGMPVEEAIVSWMEISASGRTAQIRGERHTLHLEIETPADAGFELLELQEQSHANAKDIPLKRLVMHLPPLPAMTARIVGRIEVV